MLGFFDDEPAWARLLVLETSSEWSARSSIGAQLYGVLIALLDPDGDPDALRRIGTARAGVDGRARGRWRLFSHPYEHARRRRR